MGCPARTCWRSCDGARLQIWRRALCATRWKVRRYLETSSTSRVVHSTIGPVGNERPYRHVYRRRLRFDSSVFCVVSRQTIARPTRYFRVASPLSFGMYSLVAILAATDMSGKSAVAVASLGVFFACTGLRYLSLGAVKFDGVTRQIEVPRPLGKVSFDADDVIGVGLGKGGLLFGEWSGGATCLFFLVNSDGRARPYAYFPAATTFPRQNSQRTPCTPGCGSTTRDVTWLPSTGSGSSTSISVSWLARSWRLARAGGRPVNSTWIDRICAWSANSRSKQRSSGSEETQSISKSKQTSSPAWTGRGKTHSPTASPAS